VSRPLIAAEYMTRFTCIGPDCEDTCCQGWRVNLTKGDYTKIRAIADSSGDPRFDEALREQPEKERVAHNWGYLEHGESCACPLMDAGWCLLHRDHGEGSLPVVCATFPRMILERGDRVELHGRLSCPEVARLTLLAEEPTRLVETDAELPAIYETQIRADDNHGFYQAGLDHLARACGGLLGRDEFSLEARLYFIAYLCKRVDAYLRQGVAADPASRLARLIGRMEDPRFLGKLAEEWASVPAPTDGLLSLLFGVLNARLSGPQNARYNPLREAVLARAAGGQIAADVDMATLRTALAEARSRAYDRFGDRLARYDLNFAASWWAQAFYLGDPTVMLPVRKFLFYRAMTRLLFFFHPALDGEGDPDTAIVESVQIFMKTIDANLHLLHSVLGSMDNLVANQITGLAGFLRV